MKAVSRVHITPHMHWDREWYFTTEESRILLVNNMEEILTRLEPQVPRRTHGRTHLGALTFASVVAGVPHDVLLAAFRHRPQAQIATGDERGLTSGPGSGRAGIDDLIGIKAQIAPSLDGEETAAHVERGKAVDVGSAALGRGGGTGSTRHGDVPAGRKYKLLLRFDTTTDVFKIFASCGKEIGRAHV